MHMDVFVSQTAPQFFLIILLALQIKKKQSVKSFSQLIHPSDWDPSIQLYGVNFYDLGVFKLRCTKKRMSQMQLATCNNQNRLVFLISIFDDLLLLCCQIEISITL
jgi:hypothetical protein